jgi:hypothetical protein
MDAPVVAVSNDGRKVGAAWMDMRSGGGNRDVQWTLGSASSLPKEQRANDEERGNQGHPSLVFDASLDLWCAWEDGRNGTSRIYAASFARKKNVPISSEAEGDCAFPCLAAGGATLGVCYESKPGVSFRVIATK